MRQGQPPRSTKNSAFISSRIGHDRRRPVSAGGGSSGARSCHSASVRSLGERISPRSCSARVSGVHIEGSRNGGALRFHGIVGIQVPHGGFETASQLDFGHSSSIAGDVYQAVECNVGEFGYIVYFTRRFKTTSGP